MIFGIGNDLMEVDRIRLRINQEAGFREMVFSSDEIRYCETKLNPFEFYAARFAAKEAFLKALGTGWIKGTAFNEIEVTHNNQGKPEFNFLGETRKTMDKFNIRKIFISLTHLKSIASAVVIIEK